MKTRLLLKRAGLEVRPDAATIAVVLSFVVLFVLPRWWAPSPTSPCVPGAGASMCSRDPQPWGESTRGLARD